MSDAATTAERPVQAPQARRSGGLGGAAAWVMDKIRQTEVDVRLVGMVIALALILVGIELGDSKNFFDNPTNLLNLVVQATPVAIIATGMVLVIVTRQIDLSELTDF